MNSGGAHCLKYGVTTNNLMGVTMVLMDGEVVEVVEPLFAEAAARPTSQREGLVDHILEVEGAVGAAELQRSRQEAADLREDGPHLL